MNESQKHSKVEMEIQKYEREMLRAAKIKHLKEEPLAKRIEFVINDSNRKDWTSEEMKAELVNLGLAENITTEQVEQELNKLK